ncbi:ABC transporter transmembrane region 2-domain-containing protein [Halteromyces radiatus]|uniref:ABC transporter transmembrane region 2-domain-containing protein n=1 Tax=Halteromyces radiatus TaxID=101107 RepID=UPI0022211119|nr:ABC transporter transmembrane region 2-domain-containing protein [Halteromyces radiatus]KAI8085114.1 ABC transporter transmembrane region 2-domain-containing protein [Halteromyces radiatus]
MAHALSIFSRRTKTLSGAGILTIAFAIYKARRYIQTAGNQVINQQESTNTKGKQPKVSLQKTGTSSQFLDNMKQLLPICIPGFFSKESGLLVALTTIIIVRTSLDIWFSGFNGKVVKAIVSRNRKEFFTKIIFEFGLMMWPMSIVNNSLKLTISALSLSFRERLTKYAHNQYLDGISFSKVSNLDSRLQNADQHLTQDIDKFSDHLAHLYSDITKPVVDIFLFAYKLGEAIGNESPIYIIAYFVLSGVLLRTFSPPFGRYAAIEQKLEDDFRLGHAHIISHTESVVFDGGERQKEVVNNSFQKIVNHVRKVYTLRFLNGIFDSVLVKYCATITAYYLLARPVFDARYATKFMGALQDDPVKLVEDYSRNSSYLINLSQAVGRLILTGRDLTRFAGYTSRVSELFDVLGETQ